MTIANSFGMLVKAYGGWGRNLVIEWIGNLVNGKAKTLNFMQQATDQTMSTANALEARYAYYRRCQERCKGGEQCKAPAEKGAAVCYAHARQRSMAARREAERLVVLTKAAAELRRRGAQDAGMVDLFTSFNGIQITIAAAAQALIDGSLDCKTAGRLLWDLQRMAKLLRVYHRATRTQKLSKSPELPKLSIENQRIESFSPLICSDERRLRIVWTANEYEKVRISKAEVLTFPSYREWPNGPPGYAKAA